MRGRQACLGWLWLTAAACGYYDSSLLAGAPDASAAGDAGDAGAAGGPSCPHAGPPDKPAVQDAGGSLDLVFVLSRIDFGYEGDAGAAVGFDIDRTCSCQGESDSCLEPAWAVADHCDGPGGRDNAGGKLLGEFAKLLPAFSTAEWNKQLQDGAWAVIVRVRGYNGEPDDDQVEVAWYMADSFHAIVEQQDGGRPKPVWDGNDEWPITGGCLEPTAGVDGGLVYDVDRPKSVDSKAYVSGGVLVAMLPHGQIPVVGAMRVELTEPYLSVRLAKQGEQWRLTEGTIAAVWTLEDIFQELGYVSLLGAGLCVGSTLYSNAKKLICKHADIYRSRGTPTTPCDSLSVGIATEGMPARLGGVTQTTPAAKQCTDANDPAHDSCDGADAQ